MITTTMAVLGACFVFALAAGLFGVLTANRARLTKGEAFHAMFAGTLIVSVAVSFVVSCIYMFFRVVFG